MTWRQVSAFALALVGACGDGGHDGARCPVGGFVEIMRTAEDTVIAGTFVECGGPPLRICEAFDSWSARLVRTCDRSRVDICSENFAVPDCVELYVDADATGAQAQLVVQDDVGDEPDDILPAEGGHIDLEEWRADGTARGRFELDLGETHLRGTFALDGPADAGP